MKIFPVKNYTLELNNVPEHYIELLKSNTLASDTLGTQMTGKPFIGSINGNSFKLIGSEIGIGAFAVISGEFENNTVNVAFEINKPFKILISILFVMCMAGTSFNAYKNGFPRGLGMIVPVAMFMGLLRFGFLGLFFNTSSNSSLRKFERILNLKAIRNEV